MARFCLTCKKWIATKEIKYHVNLGHAIDWQNSISDRKVASKNEIKRREIEWRKSLLLHA
jgi:hypothetical protein